jgi:hypothetical protein
MALEVGGDLALGATLLGGDHAVEGPAPEAGALARRGLVGPLGSRHMVVGVG